MEAQVHKYMKPKFPSPVLNRLVSGVQHLFSSNGICVLISLCIGFLLLHNKLPHVYQKKNTHLLPQIFCRAEV